VCGNYEATGCFVFYGFLIRAGGVAVIAYARNLAGIGANRINARWLLDGWMGINTSL
jgi:hypothetical protein